MLLKRYSGNLDFVFSLPISDGADLILQAINADKEEMIMNRWLIGGYERYGVSYQEFKNKIISANDNRTSKEILKNVENLLENYCFGGDEV